MATNPPRERGRPPLPTAAQKAHLNITLDRDVLEWIDTQGTKRSRIINKLLRRAFAAAAQPPRGAGER